MDIAEHQEISPFTMRIHPYDILEPFCILTSPKAANKRPDLYFVSSFLFMSFYLVMRLRSGDQNSNKNKLKKKMKKQIKTNMAHLTTNQPITNVCACRLLLTANRHTTA